MSESSLFQHRVLVVNQKAKLIELTNQYSVFDENGNNIGHVNQVGQSKAKKLLRLVSSVDQFLTHQFDITDASDSLVMSVTRPAKILKSTVLINDSTGAEIGRIVQENVFGKIHFALEAGGVKIGAIKAVRTLKPELGLGEAKAFVEAAPKTVLEGAEKAVAEAAKKTLEDAGCVVELK